MNAVTNTYPSYRANLRSLSPAQRYSLTISRLFLATLLAGTMASGLVFLAVDNGFGLVLLYLLPIVAVENAQAAIDYVNAHERPLALYWFGEDRGARDRVLAETISGGVTINDTLLHIAQESLPFGGVGPSGQGAYHGEFGFRQFSKEKPVFIQSRLSGVKLLYPPYGAVTEKMLKLLARIS